MTSFDEIEKELSRLMAACQPAFTQTGRTEVKRFLDVGEYGLALETVLDICTEEHKVLSPDARTIVGDLAALMGLAADLLAGSMPPGPDADAS